MLLRKFEFLKEKREHYYLIYIFFISFITITLILLRIIFYLFQEELSGLFFFNLLMKNRDLNFKTNYNLMYNGLIHFYNDNPLVNEKAIYLYFWYFIFYPFYIIPLDCSLYIWDLLRYVSTIYIAIKIKNLNTNRRELIFFFLFSGVGYFSDMYLNNTNWLIQLLLFQSYIQLEKNNKLLSGILFTFSTFKITLILFPFILSMIKKIKIKDLLYYFLPFLVINVPFIIFPEYFLSMISNWLQSETISSGFSILNLFLSIWRLIQPAHLMYISIIILIIIGNIKNEKKRNQISSYIYIIVFMLWILSWIIILEFAFLL